MVSSKTRKMISLAISLLVVVISLTGTALAATAPTVSTLTRYNPGLSGIPGKMARDAAGNFYVTDFWAKGIVKLDRQGNRIGFIPTGGRPSAVAVLADNRLVVAINSPQAYVAFYSQSGSAPNVGGQEISRFGTPATPLYRPSGIAVDASGYIYVVDAGDVSTSTTQNVGCVRVYSAAGAYLYVFGSRDTTPLTLSTGQYEFNQPLAIAYEKAANQIYVADTLTGRLQLYTAYNGTSMTYVKTIGVIAGKNNGQPAVGSPVRFGDPAEIAFEYNGSVLDRIYVAERGRHELTVVDSTGTNIDLKRINGSTVTGADMKYPSGLFFERTATSPANKGVLYVNSAATTGTANMLVLSIDSGAVPVPATALAINPVDPTVTSSALTVSGTVSPVYAVSCGVNGKTPVPATGSGSWSANLTLDSGANYILCSASDGTVTTFAEANTYYTGALTNAPVINIASPTAGIYTNNASVTVTGTTDTANVSLKLVNSNNSNTVYATSDANKNWSAVVTLAENSNLITVTGWKQGTAIGSATVTVNADYTPPNMTNLISFLANNATTVNAIQNLDGIVVEKNLDSIVVNTVPVATKVSLATDNTYFTIPVTLVRGSNVVTVTATDLAGNSASISRTVTLNPELPGITVGLPGDNSYLPSAGTASASGSVDATFTSVNAAGTAVTPSAGNWSTAVMAVSAGFNSYQFTASGGGNLAISEKRTINADAPYAQLAITSPAADFATNNSSVTISGNVAAGSPRPTISIDGGAAVTVSSYTSGTGLFSHSVTLATEGLHTVKVIANASTAAIRNIIYDTTLPEMAIQADAKVAPTQIKGTIEPSAKIASITLHAAGVDSQLPLSNVTFTNPSAGVVVWNANLSGYAYETISFTTADPAGNQTVRTFVNGLPTGDVDGDGAVRLSDAMATLRHVAGTQYLPGTAIDKNSSRFQGDVGSLIDGKVAQDGDVTVVDAVLILKKAYGLMTF